MSDTATGASAAPSAAPAADNTPATESQDNANQEATEEVEGQEASEASGEKTPEEAAKAADKAKADAAKAEKKLKEEIRKFKIKTDGVEEELEEAELIRRAQKATGSEKRMQEAAQYKKDVLNLLETLKSNPRKILSDPAIGVDVKKFAQEVLAQELEDEMKSPEQRRIEELERQIQDKLDEEKTTKERAAKEDYERSIAKYEQEIEQQFQEAIEASGMPKSPALLRKMAMIMDVGLQNGKEITAKQACSLAKKELEGDLKSLLGVLSDDGLETFMGKDLLKRIRKSNLQKIKAAPPTASDIKPIAAKASEAKEEKKMSIKEWLKG